MTHEKLIAKNDRDITMYTGHIERLSRLPGTGGIRADFERIVKMAKRSNAIIRSVP